MKWTAIATPPGHLRFGVLCILGYVALSWAVRFDMRLGAQIASLMYPLDTFSMYAGMPGEDASHLLVRDTEGQVHRVTAFRSYTCADPIVRPAARCTQQRGIIPYHYDDFVEYIQRHAGGDDLDVELIVRNWKLRNGRPPEHTEDCVVTRCMVSR
jgi:hypothetical protein